MRRVVTVVVSSLLLGILLPLTATAAAQGWDPCGDALSGVYPRGYEVVWAPHQGGSGEQIVLGTDGPDDLVGGSGEDILCGYGGDDVLEGNSGYDWLDAGTGSNALYGGSGNDTLIGMEGDVFVGSSGKNTIIANTPPPTGVVSFIEGEHGIHLCDYTLSLENGPVDTDIHITLGYTDVWDGSEHTLDWDGQTSATRTYEGWAYREWITKDRIITWVQIHDTTGTRLYAVWEGSLSCRST